MLLTYPQPHKTEYGGRTTHDFTPRFRSCATSNPGLEYPVTTLQASFTSLEMSTPHRGLPPPSAMTLPDPMRQPQIPQPGLSSAGYPQALGPMPPQPSQWQGQEESMRQWLAAKSEEDKRKQEEEKTRQESLRLEQRRVEHSILRESLQAGVPPQMVPLIYAGIGGANLAQVSLDWLHQYVAQLQAAQQQLHQIAQAAPEYQKDPRLLGQPPGTFQPVYAAPLPPGPAVEPQSQQPLAVQATFNAYQPPSRPGQTPIPRSATHTQLPRLTTNEMHVQQPPANHPSSSAHPLHQSQRMSEQPGSSPSIYFHHWVPPSETKDTKPNPGGGNTDPGSAPSGQDSSEYRDSPRKRKAQGGHQANPPPSSSNPMNPSPSFSNTSSGSGRRGISHQRSRSNMSMRDPESSSRPDSRRDPDPPFKTSVQSETAQAMADISGDRTEKPPTRQEDNSQPGSEPPKS